MALEMINFHAPLVWIVVGLGVMERLVSLVVWVLSVTLPSRQIHERLNEHRARD